MFIFGIILLSISAIALIAATLFFVLYRIFEFHPQMLGKCTASLKSVKHKKDVPVYERNSSRAPRHIIMIIKNWSKGVYSYSVNDKNYKAHYVNLDKPAKMPATVQVVYLKGLPRISYVKTDTNFHHFEIYSFAALMFSILSAMWGFSVIFH